MIFLYLHEYDEQLCSSLMSSTNELMFALCVWIVVWWTCGVVTRGSLSKLLVGFPFLIL